MLSEKNEYLDLLEEAHRCLRCKNAKCQKFCPIRTNIPEIIELYQQANKLEAGKILFQNNPLSVICAVVCPHEEQCLGNCIRGIKSQPIPFYKIESELSTLYLNSLEYEKPLQDKELIAIVGGGPAGITIAFLLAMKGYKVTIFDAHDKIGGVLRYGIPDFRLDKTLIDKLEEKLIQLGVKIRPNTLIGPVITLDRLFEDGYKAAFIGTGVWNPKTLGIKGETLGHVHYAIDYLKAPNSYRLGKKVVVIGAGNVAMDAARTAKLNQAEHVYVVYRKTEVSMSATKHEISEAKKEGVEFVLLKEPVRIEEKGVVFRTFLEIKNEDGTFTYEPQEAEELVECNSVIIAISQSPKANIVSNTKKLDTDRWGLLITDELGNTTKEGTFASGDVVTGAKTVVEAVVQAKVVADTMDKYCRSLAKKEEQ